MLKKEEAFVIIEEPEAHLYPGLQYKVIEFIAHFANMSRSSVMITTHSPYILTSVNILYCAGKIIQEFPELSKKVYETIGSRCEIIPEKVTAFKIEKDTSIRDLVNEEFAEINTEMIDEISDVVNEAYTALFYAASENNR